jgi:hypothetical protein
VAAWLRRLAFVSVLLSPFTAGCSSNEPKKDPEALKRELQKLKEMREKEGGKPLPDSQ